MFEEKNNTQILIKTYSRRLQKLKEQKALQGLATPPEVQIEIEDIEAELDRLQIDYAAFTSPLESQHPDAPVVHIHNWNKPSAGSPGAVEMFNWLEAGKFEEHADRTRRCPSPVVWEQELLPLLESLPGEKTTVEGWVGLEGKCAISTGFAFGTVFRAKERFQIEVAQYINDKGHTEYWASNAQPPVDDVPDPSFILHIAERERMPDNPSSVAGDAVVVVGALNSKTIEEILEDIGVFWGEPEAFCRIPEQPTGITAVKGVLVLEAAAATRGRRSLEGWEVAGLARSSTQLVNNFKHRIKPQKLHLFFAGPLSLAVFMGHYWNNVRKPVQCYEKLDTDNVYGHSCLLEMR